MQAAVLHARHAMTVEEVDAPAPGPGEILLKVECCGICGSDLHMVHAEHAPAAILGHEFAGMVVELGAGVERFSVDDTVCSMPTIGCGACASCLAGDPAHCPRGRMVGLSMPRNGAFAEYVVVGADQTYRLPPGVNAALGALVEPLAVGLKMVEKAEWRPGERMVILGGGPVGLAVVVWAHALGVGDIVVSDPVETRRALALRLGATAVCDPAGEELAAFCERELGGAPELVVECIGRPGSLDLATGLARRGGRVVIGGLHMEMEPTRRYMPFVKELKITYSMMYEMRHFAYTLRMLAQGRIDPRPMITHEVSLAELPATIAALSGPNAYGKVLVAPGRP
jgi:(R,R)-butanediol dehydrogenase/meso-butanediol dehydrogenase/diacetyl reductase